MKRRMPEPETITYDIHSDFVFIEPLDVTPEHRIYGMFRSSKFPSDVIVCRSSMGLYWLEAEWELPGECNGKFTSMATLKKASVRYLDPETLGDIATKTEAGEVEELVKPARVVSYDVDGIHTVERWYDEGHENYLTATFTSPHWKAPLVAVRRRDTTVLRFVDDGKLSAELVGSFSSVASCRKAILEAISNKVSKV